MGIKLLLVLLNMSKALQWWSSQSSFWYNFWNRKNVVPDHLCIKYCHLGAVAKHHEHSSDTTWHNSPSRVPACNRAATHLKLSFLEEHCSSVVNARAVMWLVWWSVNIPNEQKWQVIMAKLQFCYCHVYGPAPSTHQAATDGPVLHLVPPCIRVAPALELHDCLCFVTACTDRLVGV